MKATGIVRKIDELGRVVLPIELRRTMNLDVRDPVEIFLDGDSIVLRKYEAACLFCGGTHNLTSFRGKQICAECVRQLQEKLAYLGFLRTDRVTGRFTDSTTEAVRAYQEARGLRIIGVANRETQQLLEEEYNRTYQNDPNIWSVVDDE